MTMGRMVEMLTRAEKVSVEDQKNLRRAIQMRNQAVHDLREPDRAAALQMYSEVAEFVRRMTTIIEPVAALDEDSTALHSRQ